MLEDLGLRTFPHSHIFLPLTFTANCGKLTVFSHLDKMKYFNISALFLALALVCAGCRLQDPLSLWNDGAPAKTALLEFVADATDEGSESFIPPDERIAVFDLDGTLLCETAPTYFDWALFEKRVLDDKDCIPTAAQRDAALASRENGIFPPLSVEREQMVSEAYAGMTLEEFSAYVRAFCDEPLPGFSGLRRGDAFYRPMLEVIDYLAANAFTVYVISGTDRFTARALVAASPLKLAPRQIIGSDSEIAASGQRDADALSYIYKRDDAPVLTGRFIVKNLQMNKVSAIVKEIGAKPVLAFGNAMSDASMANYTIVANPRKALAFMLVCDDDEREYGNPAKAEKMRRACAANGWIPVSMKSDWKTIYGASRKQEMP